MTASPEEHGGYFTDEEIGSERVNKLVELTQPVSGGA